MSDHSEKDKIYFVCQHGEVAAWCAACDKLHGGPRRKAEDDFTVKSLVSFYETLEAVKSLPPAVRKARTMARIEAERVARFQQQWKEKEKNSYYGGRRRESLLTLPVPEGHVQSLRDTIYKQPNSPLPPHGILSPSSTPLKKKIVVSRSTDDFPMSPVSTGSDLMRDDNQTMRMKNGTSTVMITEEVEQEEEKKDKKATTVFIVRHGERIDHIDEKWIKMAKRPFDPGLSTRGMEQAREVGEKLKKDGETIDYIYSSPFQRTLETATEIAKVLGLRIRLENGIAESVRVESVKKWEEKEGRTWPHLRLLSEEEIKVMFPLVDFSHSSVVQTTYPETEEQLYQRIVKIVNGLPKAHEGQAILLVSHQAPVEYLAFELCAGNAQDKYVSYCCLSKAVKTPEDFAFSLCYQHEDSFLTHAERSGH